MKKNLTSILIIAIVVVGAGSFYGGMVYGKGQAPKNSFAGGQFGPGGAGAAGRRVGPAGAGMVNGTVLSKDDKSFTIKLRTGGSKIVFFSPSTKILKSVEGTINDLPINSNVTASGNANSDGSVTAQIIQLRQDLGNASGTPNFGPGGPGGQGGPNGGRPVGN